MKTIKDYVDWIKKNFPGYPLLTINDNWAKAFSKPFYDLFDRGGKRFRPILACLTYDAIIDSKNKENKKTIIRNDPLKYNLSSIIELIHTGTLIIDDIEDNSNERRGGKPIHTLYSLDFAINYGYNLVSYVNQIIIENEFIPDKMKNELLGKLSREMATIHVGQHMDIVMSNRKDYENYTIEDYITMCKGKTGSLYRLSTAIGGILSDSTNDELKTLDEITDNIAIALQIKNDYLNLKPSNGENEKMGEDIVTGKYTYFVDIVKTHGAKASKNELFHILRKKENSKDEIYKAINIINDYGALESGINKVKSYIESSKEMLNTLPYNDLYQKRFNFILDSAMNALK